MIFPQITVMRLPCPCKPYGQYQFEARLSGGLMLNASSLAWWFASNMMSATHEISQAPFIRRGLFQNGESSPGDSWLVTVQVSHERLYTQFMCAIVLRAHGVPGACCQRRISRVTVYRTGFPQNRSQEIDREQLEVAGARGGRDGGRRSEYFGSAYTTTYPWALIHYFSANNSTRWSRHAYLEPVVIHDLTRSRGMNLSELRSILVSTRRLM